MKLPKTLKDFGEVLIDSYFVVDLDRPWTVREADIRSRSKNTCHEGALLSGKALHTMVAGRTIYTEDGAGG